MDDEPSFSDFDFMELFSLFFILNFIIIRNWTWNMGGWIKTFIWTNSCCVYYLTNRQNVFYVLYDLNVQNGYKLLFPKNEVTFNFFNCGFENKKYIIIFLFISDTKRKGKIDCKKAFRLLDPRVNILAKTFYFVDWITTFFVKIEDL